MNISAVVRTKILTLLLGICEIYPIAITNGGTGYAAGALIVNNTGTGGSGLAGTYTVATGGIVNSITITNKGSGYKSVPTITPQAGGVNAVLTPSLFGFFPELAPIGTHTPFMTYHWITDTRDPLINVARPWIQLNIFHTDYDLGLVMKESLISGLDKTKAVIGGTNVIYMTYLSTWENYEPDTKLWHWALDFKLAYKEA